MLLNKWADCLDAMARSLRMNVLTFVENVRDRNRERF